MRLLLSKDSISPSKPLSGSLILRIIDVRTIAFNPWEVNSWLNAKPVSSECLIPFFGASVTFGIADSSYRRLVKLSDNI